MGRILKGRRIDLKMYLKYTVDIGGRDMILWSSNENKSFDVGLLFKSATVLPACYSDLCRSKCFDRPVGVRCKSLLSKDLQLFYPRIDRPYYTGMLEWLNSGPTVLGEGISICVTLLPQILLWWYPLKFPRRFSRSSFSSEIRVFLSEFDLKIKFH